MPNPTRLLRASVTRSPPAPAPSSSTNPGCPSSSSSTPSWSSTLRLPRSQFPARPIAQDRAGYLERCTTQLYKWQKKDAHRNQQPAFVLHDGPPYANGSLHIGHALNKILKDITLRVQLAKGRSVEYVPGWDCHGLPIELKALQRRSRELASGQQSASEDGKSSGDNGNAAAVVGKEQEREGAKLGPESYDPVDVRRHARALAAETVEQQRDAFKEWAIMGDWENAWTTMQPDFELRQLEVFRLMVEKGLIYRRFKPVYWSPSTRTALAEGELEYKSDHSSIAAFVRFKALDQENIKHVFGIRKDTEDVPEGSVSFLIWTTTPWTLPANKAIAVRNDLPYVCVHFEGIGHVIVAESRLDEVQRLCKVEHSGPIYGPVDGSELVGMQYKNDAFTTGQVSSVYHADYVSADSGTGLVHTAPGHGMDDYRLCLKHGIDPFAPVDGVGRFTRDGFSDESEACHLVGKEVLGEGNIGILKHLKKQDPEANMQIIKSYKYTHSYPYDWRSKQPIIIRATAQWFADLGDIRNLTLKAMDDIHFIPSVGRERLASTVRNRTEWCISRQRAWGVPIPALYRKDTGEPLLNPQSVSHILNTICDRGIDAWWTDPEDEQSWIPPSNRDESYIRGKDTMDVWFDSGSSWTHTGRKEDKSAEFEAKTADVYLEGSDQHRGWFQSSILTKIAYDSATGRTPRSPYKTLITHGFTLDGQGRKMSKSEGNVISPDEITNGTLLPPLKRKQKGKSDQSQLPKHDAMGPDALRLLVAGSDFTKDMQIGQETLKVVHSSLAKLRVSYRLLTGLLSDFDPASAASKMRVHDLGLVNQIGLLHLHGVSSKVWPALEAHDYHKAVTAINEYINSDFSAFYVEAIKDRMYCGSPSGHERRATQFVLWHIFEELSAMLRPIVPLLVEEAKAYMPETTQDVLSVQPKRYLGSPDLQEADALVFKLNLETSAQKAASPGQHSQMSLNDVQLLAPVVMQLDGTVKALLEEQRAAKTIGSSLQANVRIRRSPSRGTDSVSQPTNWLFALEDIEKELADIFVVSGVVIGDAADVDNSGWSTTEVVKEGPARGFEVTVYQPQHSKCGRCWKYLAEEDHDLCHRCGEVVDGTDS